MGLATVCVLVGLASPSTDLAVVGPILAFVLLGAAAVSAWGDHGRDHAEWPLLPANERADVRKTRHLESMLALAASVGEGLEIDEVMRRGVEQAAAAIPCDCAVLWRKAGDRPLAARSVASWARNPAIDVFQVVLLLPTLHDEGPHVIESDPCTSLLVAPLRHQGAVVGWIAIERRHRTFDATEIELAGAIAQIVGQSLAVAVGIHEASSHTDLDPVTGLLNHRALHEQLDLAFAYARGNGKEISALLMDVENFGLFNATYGHPVGDGVLRMVAGALSEECPAQGAVGRFGGDEFVMVLPGMGAAEALALVAKINGRLATEGFAAEGAAGIVPISLCTGIATFPSDCNRPAELLAIAERNLERARLAQCEVACSTELQRDTNVLRQNESFATLEMLIAAVDNKDAYTRRHSEEVAEYAMMVARDFGCDQETLHDVYVAALLHDVGKIGVPKEILAKPEKLTIEEHGVVSRHAWLGAMIINAFPGMERIVEAVRHHHERWDGTGYPDGLAGEGTPWIARLLAVADTYSAMTTDRPYRRSLDPEAALAEMERHAGRQFDPAIAAAFVRCVSGKLAAGRDRHAA